MISTVGLCNCYVHIIVPFLLSVFLYCLACMVVILHAFVDSWLVGHNARFGHMQLHYSCLL